MEFGFVFFASAAAIAAVAIAVCAWELDRLSKWCEREGCKTQALLAEIRDKLGK